MKSLPNDLTVYDIKFKDMEMTISEMQDLIASLNYELKETQKFLIKLAHNQAELTKRISLWPYIPVPEES